MLCYNNINGLCRFIYSQVRCFDQPIKTIHNANVVFDHCGCSDYRRKTEVIGVNLAPGHARYRCRHTAV